MDKRTPKWDTHGNSGDVFHILGDADRSRDIIVLVEDIVSAIKVSRYVPCMPLFGSEVIRRLPRLARITKALLIWLDPDKTTYAIRAAGKAAFFFEAVQTVLTAHDPKLENVPFVLGKEMYREILQHCNIR